MNRDKFVIGSRKSRLALFQSYMVKDLVEMSFPGLEVVVKPIITKGDRILDKPLSSIGEKGIFTEELEDALLNEEIDMAVHSLKDLPTELSPGLEISAYTEREDPRDCLISKGNKLLDELHEGAVVATSSLRRRSQLLGLRPDLEIVDLRGNVETRIGKLEEEPIDAILIAAAGVIRLGMKDKISEIMTSDKILPAAGQGIIAVENKKGRKDLENIFDLINVENSRLAARAERTLLNAFGGGCQIPIGALARVKGDQLFLDAYIGSINGKNRIRQSMIGNKNEAASMGETLAQKMLEAGGDKIIEEMRNEC